MEGSFFSDYLEDMRVWDRDGGVLAGTWTPSFLSFPSDVHETLHEHEGRPRPCWLAPCIPRPNAGVRAHPSAGGVILFFGQAEIPSRGPVTRRTWYRGFVRARRCARPTLRGGGLLVDLPREDCGEDCPCAVDGENPRRDALHVVRVLSPCWARCGLPPPRGLTLRGETMRPAVWKCGMCSVTACQACPTPHSQCQAGWWASEPCRSEVMCEEQP